MCDMFTFFFLLSLKASVFYTHDRHILVQTNHISSAQQLHMASGYLIGQHVASNLRYSIE